MKRSFAQPNGDLIYSGHSTPARALAAKLIACQKKLYQALKGGASDGYKLSETDLETAKDTYFRLAGWDIATGVPGAEKLRSLDLASVVDLLEAAGIHKAR